MIYILYNHPNWENNTYPIAIFRSKEMADEWIDNHKDIREAYILRTYEVEPDGTLIFLDDSWSS
jgi:hypothetical protein